MKHETPVCHWRGEHLNFLNKNGCIEYSDEEFLFFINTLAHRYDVMIKKEDDRLVIYLDDKGKNFKQRYTVS
jgi:hypothetical protein